MAITTYMNYVIFFQDPAEYAFAVGIAGSSYVEMAPRDAASLFGIPHPYPSGPMESIAKGIFFFYPFTPGAEFFYPGPTGIFVNDAVASQLIPGQAGNPASVWPPGQDGLFKWAGTILKSGGGAGTEETVTGIAQRRWIGGKELFSLGEGGTAITVGQLTRSASRTGEGFGYAIRGQNSGTAWNRTVDEYRTGLQPKTSWERFYVRVRTVPTLATGMGIWRCHGFPSNAAGCGLKINTAGNLEVFEISSAGIETSKGTSALTLNQWYRIDVLLKYDTGGGTDGRIRIYIGGALAVSFDTAGGGGGMNQNSRHTNSDLGRWTAGDNVAEIDLDDWMCADLPGNCSTATLSFINDDFSIDWLLGSHLRCHFTDPLSVDTTITNWTGEKGAINQGYNPTTILTGGTLVSTTALAQIVGLTDALPQDTPDTLAISYGAAAAVVGEQSLNAGATDGQLGYKKAGGAATLTTINQTAAQAEHSVLYMPSGMIIPDEISPWSVVKQKSNDANSDTTRFVQSIVEYLGTWGPEDDSALQLLVDRNYLHNCRYQNTVWGYIGPTTDSPCYIVGGTYVGNGTYQEIELPAPCHFLWIRATSGAPTGGIKWYGAGINGNLGATERVLTNVRVWSDFVLDAPTGQARFSVHGTTIECNQNAITYQYIAFCDPGMRFSLCGAFQHPAAGATSFNEILSDANFQAECAFAQWDTINAISNAAGLWYRGPGHAGNAGNALSGGAITDFGSFGLGVFTSGDTIIGSNAQTNYTLFRTSEPICAGIMVQCFTYTGDGAASRNIPMTPASGRFPIFVLVIPSNANPAVFRDPSHAAAASSNANTLAGVANGITAVNNIDEFTVGITLNANGVVYHVFAFPGSDAGMLNGTYFNPNCDGGGITPTVITGINILPEGGLILNGTTQQTILKDISGIYTLIPGKTDDSLIDRQTGQTSLDVKIPDPTFKTGYVGG